MTQPSDPQPARLAALGAELRAWKSLTDGKVEYTVEYPNGIGYTGPTSEAAIDAAFAAREET